MRERYNQTSSLSYCFVLLLALLQSCSGGSGGSDGGVVTIIDRSGVHVGAISGFGSVIVNGVEFDTTSATITIDDAPSSESLLRVGQVVTLQGLVDSNSTTGTASAVTTDPNLRGVISAIDPGTGSITVLSRTVRITSGTIVSPEISPADITGLAVGDRVEVYGFVDANGGIDATLITSSNDTELELQGRVTNLDPDNSVFTVVDLAVDFSSANLVGFSSALANGDLVEVEGASLDSDNRLVADRVEFESATVFSAEDEGTELQIEGIITRFTDTTSFDVGDVAVLTNGSTEFESGLASDLRINAKIEVEGTVDAQGRLLARSIEFESESDLELEATVESVSPTEGTVTLLGLALITSSQTQFIDESDRDVRTFSIDDIEQGDFVKAKALSGGLTATLIERKNPEDALKISRAVSDIQSPIVFIGGAQVATNASTEFELEDQAVSSADFFAALSIGMRVEAQGQSNTPGVLDAEKLEASN